VSSNQEDRLPKTGADAEFPPASTIGQSSEGASYVLAPGEHSRWDQFAASSPQGTIFQTAWWYRAWGLEPIVNVMADKNGNIEGGICYCVGRRLGASAMVRPPMTPCNGPVVSRLPLAARHKENTHVKKMMLMAIHALPRLGVYDIILRSSQADVTPFLWNGFDTYVGYTYVIPCAERETWLQNASKTQRWQIRKAMRDAAEKGFRIESDVPLDAVLPLLKDTADVKQFSLGKCVARLPDWWNAVGSHGAGRTYLLRDDQGRPAAATLMVWDAHCAYYLAGGIRRDLRKSSIINVLLVHRMVEDAHRQGLDFDFEGSILPGVERFFRSFGGQLRPCYRLVKLRSLPAYLIWAGHRYWSGHRRKPWVWHD
jgi:hypothetical protein